MARTKIKPTTSTKEALSRARANRGTEAKLTSTRRTRTEAAAEPVTVPIEVVPSRARKVQVKRDLRQIASVVVEKVETTFVTFRAQWFFAGMLTGGFLFIAGVICGGFMGSW